MPLILLAEDETSTIDHVRSALASQGWLVKTVGTRDQALRAASEFAPQLVLVNESLAGAKDLVRTFSRQSGGPGVVLLTAENGDSEDSALQTPEVDAILAKPLDTGSLIETIRKGLAAAKDKPPAQPVADTAKVFSSEEIFGDFLDDILDQDAAEEPAEAQGESTAGAVAKAEKEPDVEPEVELEPEVVAATESATEEETPDLSDGEPVVEEEPEMAVAAEPEIEEETPVDTEAELEVEEDIEFDTVSEPEVEEEAEIAASTQGLAIPVAGLEDLEDVVREGVEAWADSIDPQDQVSRSEEEDMAQLAHAAAAAETESVESEPVESEESLEAKLEDTLAGVLADSLSKAGPSQKSAGAQDEAVSSVDSLLSQALGDLDLGGTVDSDSADSATEEIVADELDALAASVDLKPIVKAAKPSVAKDVKDSESVPDEVDESIEEPVEAPAAETEPEPRPEKPAAPDRPIEFGEYTLEKQIGVGGMASVWKARRKGVEGFEKRVAIKKILPQAAQNEEFVEMFIDEAKLAAQLNHSNITHIYDLGKIDDDYFIAMEYVEGKNLRQVLDQTRKKGEQLPVGLALYVTAQVADALDYAHRSKDFDDAELGLVHRDVSPQNVLISFEGDIKLCDFGIAKAVSKISTTQMGALKGKLQYMSPEQAWGKSIDKRSDIFSLGALLYEMLTGERLFSGDSEMAVLEAVREADIGAMIIQSPSILAGAKGVLLKALAKEPDDRFDDAAELQQGLEELIKKESPAPSAKELSAFLRDLLGMPADLVEAQESGLSNKQFDEAADQEWEPPADTEIDEGEKAAWLRRLLTRLLPVILVVAVGGGIIAGLMQRETPSVAESTEPVATAESTTADLPSDGDSTTPQGQPPPESAATPDPTPAPPPQQQTQQPAPTATEEEQPPAEESAGQEAVAETATVSAPPVTDPELERQVEEDLQRVQELMAAESEGEELEPTEPSAADSFSLESLWSDATSPDDNENIDTPDSLAQETEIESQEESVTQAGDLVQAGPGVSEPRVLEFEQPKYTEEARQAGVSGTVRVTVLVDENGSASEVQLVEGLAQQVGLEEAVIRSARNAVYRPASKDGVPVKMWYEVTVLFEP